MAPFFGFNSRLLFKNSPLSAFTYTRGTPALDPFMDDRLLHDLAYFDQKGALAFWKREDLSEVCLADSDGRGL